MACFLTRILSQCTLRSPSIYKLGPGTYWKDHMPHPNFRGSSYGMGLPQESSKQSLKKVMAVTEPLSHLPEMIIVFLVLLSRLSSMFSSGCNPKEIGHRECRSYLICERAFMWLPLALVNSSSKVVIMGCEKVGYDSQWLSMNGGEEMAALASVRMMVICGGVV